MSKTKPTVFKDIRLVGVHKEPTFGPPSCSVCGECTPLSGNHECSPTYKQLQAELATAREENAKITIDCINLRELKMFREGRFKELPNSNPYKDEPCQNCVQLATAKAENEDLCDNIDAARQDLADYLAGTLEGKLWAENERLKEFARPVIRQECWSIFEQDGLEIQKLAEKLKLIVAHIATAEDVDNEQYEDMGYQVGDDMFIFSETMKESNDGRKNLTSEL